MTNTKLLNKIIRESGLTKTFIAKKMGISRASLYDKLNGSRPFTQYEIRDICNILSIKNPKARDNIFFS